MGEPGVISNKLRIQNIPKSLQSSPDRVYGNYPQVLILDGAIV